MRRGGEDTVAAVKAKLDIVDIVRRYVDLKRIGGRWMGPCPFHQETKPSFSVNEEQGFFYCFGCQEKGDIIDFYSKINGLEFKDALAELAREAGVELAFRRTDPREAEARDFRRLCLRMYEFAAQRFQNNLGGPGGRECREYLADRGISGEIVQSFGLGWSMPGWSDLEDFLKAKGFASQKAAEAGLLSKNDKGRIYDRFRERLMFPIINLSNQVIAFGGRVIKSDQDPKYINSSDTEIYKKGDHLYGLQQGRRTISQKKSVLLTEGYMDVLTLHQFGYTNSCGVLGTALTANQVKRLAGFCSRVDLLFDGDAAGRKAAMRSCEMILPLGLNCRVALMPQGEDADSLLRSGGRDTFDSVLAEAADGLDYCVAALKDSHSPGEILDWAVRFTTNLKKEELLAFYLPRLMAGLGLDEAALRPHLARKAASARSGAQAGPGPGNPRSVPAAGAARIDVKSKQERQLLSFIIRHPRHIPFLRGEGAEALLASEWSRRLWELVVNRETHEMNGPERDFLFECQSQQQALAGHEEKELQDVTNFVRKAFMQREKRRLSEALKHASSADGGQAADEGSDELELLRALQQTIGRNDGQR